MAHHSSSVNKSAADVGVVLEQRFGLLMSSDEVRSLLKYNSASALSMARKRGHLTLSPKRLPGRRQLMFLTAEVAAAFKLLVDQAPRTDKEVTMDP